MSNFSKKSYFKEEAKEGSGWSQEKFLFFYFKDGRNLKNVKILLGRIQERDIGRKEIIHCVE